MNPKKPDHKKKAKKVSVVLEKPLLDKIRRAAADPERSVSSWVRQLILDHFKQTESSLTI